MRGAREVDVWCGASVEDGVEAVENAEVAKDVVVEEAELLSALMHCENWHLKPRGQHESPQVSRTPSRLVVCIWFAGWSVASCCDRSHVMGAIVEQSAPLGQQSTD